MKKTKTVLLTFDVEEFDTPLLHNIPISETSQLEIAQQGLLRVLNLLDECDSPACTFYTTANYALNYPETIQKIAKHHEIASHTFYHHLFHTEDILKSKVSLEKIIQKEVYGFRMPNMASFDQSLIRKAGYVYDSSINPTYLPGKYNYLNSPIKPYRMHDIWEIPASVVPLVRFPLFWLSFKNLPLPLYIQLCNFTIRQTGFLNLYFHPWEFSDLAGFKIPSFIKNPHGEFLLDKLKKLITYFRSNTDYTFETTIDFVTKNASSFLG